MAGDFVENIRLLNVVEIFTTADKGGHRKGFVGQQTEKTAKRNQRGHGGGAPAGGCLQHAVDFAQLRNAVERQLQFG